MKTELANPYPGKKCFFCGSGNEYGLHLKFYHDDERCETSAEYVPADHLAGQGDILHGGIQMGLLDEIMGWASFVHTCEMAVTSKMEVQFLRPVYISGEPVRLVCRVIERIGRKVHLQAELVNAENIVCTKAAGMYHILAPEIYAALIQGEKAQPAIHGTPKQKAPA